jgi:hypothetical protein
VTRKALVMFSQPAEIAAKKTAANFQKVVILLVCKGIHIR